MVRVVATARGHDGLAVREPGEEFDVPETLLKHEVKLTDDKGKPTGEVQERKASWFKPVVKKAAPESEEAIV